MKLRYVGALPTTFITGAVGTVEPGTEFTVPDELAPAFLARADVEEVAEVEVEEAKPARKRPRDEDPESLAPAGEAEGPRE
jgi:hypothetical protein